MMLFTVDSLLIVSEVNIAYEYRSGETRRVRKLGTKHHRYGSKHSDLNQKTWFLWKVI